MVANAPFLKLPAVLAPTKVAVLPLVKKDGLPDLAHEIVDSLKWEHAVSYDEKDAVGRRYRRQDALGTPYCITVDHQSLEDKTVTLRDRDSYGARTYCYCRPIGLFRRKT